MSGFDPQRYVRKISGRGGGETLLRLENEARMPAAVALQRPGAGEVQASRFHRQPATHDGQG